MDVSNFQSGEMTGTELIEMLVALTGLPPDLARKELDTILLEAGCSAEGCTLDDLRAALIIYLEKLGGESTSVALSEAAPVIPHPAQSTFIRTRS